MNLQQKYNDNTSLVPALVPLQGLGLGEPPLVPGLGEPPLEAWPVGADVPAAEPLAAASALVPLGVPARLGLQPVGHRLGGN